MSGRDRSRGRRPAGRVVVASALAGVALLGGLKLTTLNLVQEHRPDLLAVLDVVQPWRSSLARGDARYTDGDLVAAAARFSEGVQRAPDDGSRCLVRVNLALTQWRQAQLALDAGGTEGPAVSLLVRAAATADARRGERCSPADEATLAAVADAVRAAQVRAALPDVPATSSGPTPPTDDADAPPDQDALDAVADEARQGAAQRLDQGDREQSMQGDGRSSDTPW